MNYLLKSESSVYYECGYSCESEIFIALSDERFFITDGRYTIEAKEGVKGAEVIEAKESLLESAKEILKKSAIKEIIYDPKEWSVFEFEKLKADLSLNFKAIKNFSQKRRIIKRDEEIEKIKKSVQIGAKCFDRYARYLQNALGKEEFELHFDALDIFGDHGRRAISFDPIIALDHNSAKPHAHPTATPLRSDSFILLDAGVKYERYCSDRTRCSTFASDLNFDKTQHFNNPTHQKIYDIVRKAQEAAIQAIRPGVKAKEIDRAAREVIAKAGYEKAFVHSTGHGVGLDIHEEPFINRKSETIIEENMIFTVEPGIYLEDQFGVRIEDMIRVTAQGAEIL